MKDIRRIAAAVTAACMLPVCGCVSAADYSENTGEIHLDTMSVTGKGVSADGGTVTITEGGDFTVTGEAEDAMIYVNAPDKVKLRLSGVTLKNADGPAIFFDNAEKALITITEGTENYIEDGAEYAEDAKAAIFSNDDLEIKGNGTLTVVGNHQHGIASDDDIKIENGTIDITANVKDGVHANNDIEISGGNITVASETQGFQAEQNFILSGGNVNVTKCTEGVESGAGITINGGEIDVTASDDGLNSGGGTGTGGGNGGFGGGREMNGEGQRPADFDPSATPPAEGQPSAEGQSPTMPDGGEFRGHGGRGQMPFDGQAPDGGQMPDMRLPADGQSPADGQCPADFDPSATPSAEGQSPTMPDGGNFNRHGGMGGGMQPIDDGVDRNTYINGGVVRVNAEGDGLDSNADIIMTGGEVYVDGPTSSGNGAIDCFSFNVSGGTVVAVGASGMATGLSQESEQCGIMVNTEIIPAGTLIELKDGDEVIMSYTAAKDISSVVYSSDKLKEGGEYTLLADGKEIEKISMTAKQVTAGERAFGGFGGGRGGFGAGVRNTANDGRIRVILNNRELRLDADPVTADDTTLIPLRNVLEALGLTVEWDEETSAVTASKDGVNIALKIGSKDARVNGEKRELLTAPVISNDRTLVPVRFIAESLGLNVDWDEAARTVIITE